MEKLHLIMPMGGRGARFFRDGFVQPFSEEKAAAILAEKAVHFSCDMKMGTAEATAWGCDLTHEYVTINGDYRS